MGAAPYDCKTVIFLTKCMQIRFRKRNKAPSFANMQFLTLKCIIRVYINLNENRNAVLACCLSSKLLLLYFCLSPLPPIFLISPALAFALLSFLLVFHVLYSSWSCHTIYTTFLLSSCSSLCLLGRCDCRRRRRMSRTQVQLFARHARICLFSAVAFYAFILYLI